MTIEVDFQRGGQSQYKCTTFAGYVGCLTGMNKAFALSVDERDKANSTFIDNVLAVFKGGKSLGFLLRDTLQNEATFNGYVDSDGSHYFVSIFPWILVNFTSLLFLFLLLFWGVCV